VTDSVSKQFVSCDRIVLEAKKNYQGADKLSGGPPLIRALRAR
jgi:hypothetical protein